MSALRPVAALGRSALHAVGFVGSVGILVEQALVKAPTLVFKARGRRLAWSNLWFQMHRVGVRSIGVVALVTFAVGAILSLQMGPILQQYGAEATMPAIIGIAMLRELGPLIGAIVLTGFAGASIAAELGTMAVGEEISALKSHAINPIRFLVVPRLLATIVMTVCLAILSDWMGIIGGMVTTEATLGTPYGIYLTDTFNAVKPVDFISGLIKAAVFGGLIGGLACYLGINVRGGAEGVGNATTMTVVISIVAIVVVDLLFTYVFWVFGW
ncbi:MAG: ABC transporter permease [Planctomycetota bacterium]